MSRLIFMTILIFAFCAAAFAQAEKDVCPTIKISVPDNLEVNETAFAAAEVGEEIKKYNVEYIWTVERGKLLEGQGTEKIKILRETRDQVIITLEIKGLPSNCVNLDVKSAGAFYCGFIPPFDSFGESALNDEKGRFDNLFVHLRNDEANQAVVIFELDKRKSKARKRKRFEEISKFFNLRKIDKSRFTFIVYESDEEFTKFYLYPKNINRDDFLYPDDKDYKLIKGEEFQQKIDELFPKK